MRTASFLQTHIAGTLALPEESIHAENASQDGRAQAPTGAPADGTGWEGRRAAPVPPGGSWDYNTGHLRSASRLFHMMATAAAASVWQGIPELLHAGGATPLAARGPGSKLRRRCCWRAADDVGLLSIAARCCSSGKARRSSLQGCMSRAGESIRASSRPAAQWERLSGGRRGG
jgi:hypothetical protein